MPMHAAGRMHRISLRMHTAGRMHSISQNLFYVKIHVKLPQACYVNIHVTYAVQNFYILRENAC